MRSENDMTYTIFKYDDIDLGYDMTGQLFMITLISKYMSTKVIYDLFSYDISSMTSKDTYDMTFKYDISDEYMTSKDIHDMT
ncbi:hypothetical protein CEXT_636651 [Caerostris extrusa]|uniref:Uncharacterized protein n=1 Tax=Caerostris extrusa TaxID=172846 RepID=A0AAV4QE46_CAEEX|nr:hypothetical protein CEXT_636651 [Caerostris extrusa]